MRRQGNGDARGCRTLWLTAAVLAAIWVPQLRADEIRQRPNPPAPSAQTATGPQSAEALAQELAVTKRDLDTLLTLLNRACSAEPPGMAARREADPGSVSLRKSLHDEQERASL